MARRVKSSGFFFLKIPPKTHKNTLKWVLLRYKYYEGMVQYQSFVNLNQKEEGGNMDPESDIDWEDEDVDEDGLY